MWIFAWKKAVPYQLFFSCLWLPLTKRSAPQNIPTVNICEDNSMANSPETFPSTNGSKVKNFDKKLLLILQTNIFKAKYIRWRSDLPFVENCCNIFIIHELFGFGTPSNLIFFNKISAYRTNKSWGKEKNSGVRSGNKTKIWQSFETKLAEDWIVLAFQFQ